MKNNLNPSLFILPAILLVASCKKQSTSITAERKNITEVVYASGILEPQNQFTLYSLADGTIAQMFVGEGDTVSASKPILRIDGNATEARLYSAEEIYKTAYQNYGESSPALLEVKAQLNTLSSRLHTDSLNYTRYKNLYAQNAVKKTDFEKYELAYINTQNEYQAAKQRLESLRNQLYITLQNAKSQYEVTRDDVANYVLTSGIKGRVYDVLKEQGELVRRGEPIAIIGDAENMVLKMSVDEDDIDKIKVGQLVLVQIEAFGEKIFKAQVSRIYPLMNKRDFAFKVDAQLIDNVPALYSGTNIEANIVIQEKKNVLCLPKTLVQPGDSVLIKTPDGKKKIKLKKGIENFEYIEVTGGIDEKTEILTK